MKTDGDGSWNSVADTLEKLNISRRTLYDRINREELTTQKEGKNRFLWLDGTIKTSTTRNAKQTDGIVKQLKSEVEYFKNKVETLELELSEQRQRHDTIMLKMTDQNQLFLQSVKRPFWKFWGGGMRITVQVEGASGIAGGKGRSFVAGKAPCKARGRGN